MSRRLEPLSEILSEVTEVRTADGLQGTAIGQGEFAFWTGATGANYVHSIYELAACPPLPAVNYVLTTRDTEAGRWRVVAIGRTSSASRTANRSAIRELADRLGASDVHVHYLGSSDRERAMIAFDIETGLSLAGATPDAGIAPSLN